MILKPTVLVLGAGAHWAYGYPSGETLKELAAEAVARSIKVNDARSLSHLDSAIVGKPIRVDRELCAHLERALRNSGQASIDAFLHANQHLAGFVELGKAAIAQVLLDLEHEHIDPNRAVRRRAAQGALPEIPRSDDWIKYLLHLMLEDASTPGDFKKNSVSFVTFNYDQLLERKLYWALQDSFGLADQEALDLVKSIPIAHVYGSLGRSCFWQAPHENDWQKSSTSLRTIFETECREGVELNKALALLHAARNILLLGFGYHKENMSLIELTKLMENHAVQVHGSSYGMTDAEWARAMRHITIGGRSIYRYPGHFKCLDALRNSPLF